MVKEIIGNKKAFIFDFDGTLFHLFTTFSFDKEIAMLKKEYSSLGYTMPDTWNPFDAFRVVDEQENSSENRLKALIRADEILTNKELEAVECGEPINGAVELLRYLDSKGYKLAIASNNSPLVVSYFMGKYLPDIKLPVLGRVTGHPELLKPNTWMLEELMANMGSKPEEVVFFGDHPRDKACADKAGVGFVGITPADYKKERMLKILDSSDICNDLVELLDIIKK